MRERAALVGGDVAVRTSPGRGTAVRATVPVMDREDGGGCPTVVKVLLVDDHPVVRAGLKALLDTSEGVRVVGEASSGEEAVEKARTIARGHSYLPRRVAALLARRQTQGASNPKPGPGLLSSQELTAVELYASGFTASEIGGKMSLSPRTVESYLARARAKLDLHSRHDLVRFALEAGLLRPEEER